MPPVGVNPTTSVKGPLFKPNTCAFRPLSHRDCYNVSFETMKVIAKNIFNKSSNNISSEHMRLLNAVEQYGFGNWEDIAKQISENGPSTNVSKKTPQQARDE